MEEIEDTKSTLTKEDPDAPARKRVGDLLKKAVSIGAGAYVSAEDKVVKTLSTVQNPKDLLKEALESFFENYTLQVNAEIKIHPKNKEKKSDDK